MSEIPDDIQKAARDVYDKLPLPHYNEGRYSNIIARALLAEREANAARIAALEALLKEAGEAVAWYGENARLARLIHREGDPGRHALAEDGGKRARAVAEKLRASR